MTNRENITLSSSFDGLKLSGTLFLSDSPRAILQIAHGMAEHKERYFDLLNELSALGISGCIFDHRGHGDSIRDKADLGYFYDSDGVAIVEDVYQITEYLKQRFIGVPVILLGHSMGSLVVRCLIKEHDEDYAGLVVCGSPSANPAASIAIMLSDIISLFKGERHPSALLAALSLGAYDKAFKEGHNAWLSADEDKVRKYNEDELCGFCFTLNGFRNLFCLMKNAYRKTGFKLSHPDLPVFFISGKDDPCMVNLMKWHESIEFMKSMGYYIVRAEAYEGLRHEVLFEGDQRVLFDLVSFIDNCIG